MRITVAKGDGIGPEIMDATLDILLAAGADIQIDEIEVGEKVYLAGNTSGISNESWDIICRPILSNQSWDVQAKLGCNLLFKLLNSTIV